MTHDLYTVVCTSRIFIHFLSLYSFSLCPYFSIDQTVVVLFYFILKGKDKITVWHVIRDFRVRSEFYCSNDVIVGNISLPHYRETVKVDVCFMSSLDSFESRCCSYCSHERYCNISTHENIFDDLFSEMMIEKTIEDMSMFLRK